MCETIWLKWSFGVSKGVLWRLWWMKGLASTCKLGHRRSRNGKLGKAARCKLVLKNQEDNCPDKWQRGWLLGIAIYWQYPTTKQVATTIKQVAAAFVEEDGSHHWLPCTTAGKKKRIHHLPINRHHTKRVMWELRITWVCERVKSFYKYKKQQNTIIKPNDTVFTKEGSNQI